MQEEASKLLHEAIATIAQSESSTSPLDREKSLVHAARGLEHAIDLIEDDDPSYNVYSQFCACASARCIINADCSSEIDRILSSSAVFANLLGHYQDSLESQSIDLDSFVPALETVWDELYDVCDQFHSSHTQWFSNSMLANHLVSFSRAIAASTKSSYLRYLWCTFRATTLYLRMDRNNPDEISLCIVSIKEALDLKQNIPLSLPGDLDPTLLKVLPEPLQDLSSLKLRLFWLEALASAYTQWHTARFREFIDTYTSNSNPSDLDRAILEAREALSWSHDTGLLPQIRFKLLFALGRALHERYWINLSHEDLEDSYDCLREAQTYGSAPADRLISCKQLLSMVAEELAKLLSDEAAPKAWLKSLDIWRECIKLTNPEAQHILAERLFHLANTAFKLYGNSKEGTSAHVSEAADCLARAASIVTSQELFAEILFRRAAILYARFAQDNNREDFLESLESGARAWRVIREIPELVRLEPQWEGTYRYGTSMLRKIQEDRITKAAEDTEEIQQLVQLFEAIVPFPHANRVNALNSLGRAYTMLYHAQIRAGQAPIECIIPLQMAEKYHQTALKNALKEGYAIIHPRYTFLGAVNHELSRIPGLEDGLRDQHLELAIEYFRKASHSKNLSAYCNLATALEDRYKILGQPQDLQECISLLNPRNTQAGSMIGHPRMFFLAAKQLVRICREYNASSHLIPAYRLLFQALRRLSNMGLTSARRHQALTERSAGHACDAAAAALALDDPVTAVELLEDGRSLFFSQLIPMQIDTRPIHGLDPQLASELEYTMQKLRQYSAETDEKDYKSSYYYTQSGFADDLDPDGMDISHQGIELRHYAHWFDTYLNKIRELPGYEDFMKPRPFSRLKDAARHCAIVYINVSQYRCDAIILGGPNEPSQPIVVPLPISWAKVHDLSRTMQNTVKLQGREVRDDVEAVRYFVRAQSRKQSPAAIIQNALTQLWECIVYPIFKAIGCLNELNAVPDKLQRVCWCPAGPAAIFLPFHAAGNYALGPEHWATTYAVSSYTPTISSLLQAYERTSNSESQPTRLLIVSLPETPPTNPLSHVVEERDGIISAVGLAKDRKARPEITVLHDSAGQVAGLKSILPAHQLLHLACHGKQDQTDPLDSAIVLYDGNLTLREIIKMPLRSAELVYLSACQTATGAIGSPEESLSLAGGFLFAGYRSAVATMWSINDRDGAQVAEAFYRYLMKRDGPLALSAPLSLHCAVHDLRSANPNIALIRWIPFMCLGVIE